MGLGRVLAPLVRGLAHGVTLALVVRGLGLARELALALVVREESWT